MLSKRGSVRRAEWKENDAVNMTDAFHYTESKEGLRRPEGSCAPQARRKRVT